MKLFRQKTVVACKHQINWYDHKLYENLYMNSTLIANIYELEKKYLYRSAGCYYNLFHWTCDVRFSKDNFKELLNAFRWLIQAVNNRVADDEKNRQTLRRKEFHSAGSFLQPQEIILDISASSESAGNIKRKIRVQSTTVRFLTSASRQINFLSMQTNTTPLQENFIK